MVHGGFGYVPPVAVGLPWDMFGIARAFESTVASGLKTEQAIELLGELQGELSRQATRRKIRSWLLVLGVSLLAIGALVAVALMAQ